MQTELIKITACLALVFCDCAACLVLDRQGACDLCPEL